MASVTWVGGSSGPDEGRWTVGSDWSTGSAPGVGDTVSIDGVANSGIGTGGGSGPIIHFPTDGSAYTSIYLFPKPKFISAGMHPATLPSLTIAGETINVNGTAGAPELWLQKTTLSNDTIQATGTVALESYLSNEITGALLVGGASGSAFVQLVLYGADVQGYGIAGRTAITTLAGSVVIAAGSTFNVEDLAGGATPAGLAIGGVVDIAAGGALMIDDTDGSGLSTPDNGLVVHNTGTVLLAGAAGQTTVASITANVAGSGTIEVAGGSGAGSTTLTLNGNVRDQALILDGGTVAVNDARTVIGDPSEKGYSVSGGSFTFGTDGGTLVLHQPALTSLESVDGGLHYKQEPNGQHPFTTPIYGFGSNDAIELVGKYIAGNTYEVAWDQATHFLQVESPASVAGNPPAIEAAFTLEGSYAASGFHLAGNASTSLLTLTYHG